MTDVNELLVTGQVPTYLVAKWEQRTGVSPVAVAAKVLRNRHIVNRSHLWTLGTAVLTLAVTSFASVAEFNHWFHLSADDILFTMVASLGAFLACMAVDIGVMLTHNSIAEALFPREACGFNVLYGWFISASGKTQDELAHLDSPRLREIAERILVKLARDVVEAQAKTQNTDGNEPDTKFTEAEVECRRAFDRSFLNMQRLLPINTDKKVYYRKARKQPMA